MAFGSESLDLPEGVFTILRDLILERTGVHFEHDRRSVLADKLSPRALERGFSSILDYYYLLKYGPGADEEWPLVLDALSVPETYFWREMDQIRALVDVLIPEYVSTNPGKTVGIWCAACATGEEPLSIAMALAEAGWLERAHFRIFASDASQSALLRARKGHYKERSFRNLGNHLQRKYFAEATGGWQVAPELHARIEWAQVNLMAAEQIAPFLRSPFVFCRNVFIYFSSSTIAKTVRRFAQGMPRPAYLFTGVSESLLRVSSDFQLREVQRAFVYVLE
jgi:chemotaxis protein methyltransferase CheR